jgi:hypothetical protein
LHRHAYFARHSRSARWASAGRVATGSAALSLPVLSRQPGVVVLAMVPVGLAALAVTCKRRVGR